MSEKLNVFQSREAHRNAFLPEAEKHFRTPPVWETLYIRSVYKNPIHFVYNVGEANAVHKMNYECLTSFTLVGQAG